MATVKKSVETLRRVLLDADSAALEKLTADLLGRLVGVDFRVAQAGSQGGGDGGVRGPRNLIYESRRYGDTSHLDARAIRGEISQAVERNPDLEAWILVTTRKVPEQTGEQMENEARPRGVEAVVIDWRPRRLPRLAALCASDPDSFEARIGAGHDELIQAIASSADYASVLESIKKEFYAPSIGYELLRKASHRRVREIWTSRKKAKSLFNQDVAGGQDGTTYVERAGPRVQLDNWYRKPGEDCPAIVVGLEGMGKTWVSIGWLHSRLQELPIVIAVPSSSIVGPVEGRSDLVALIARHLRNLDHGVERDQAYWEQRVRRLLHRPSTEGPILLLYIDGLNQQPSFGWLSLLNSLQDDPFYRRTCVLASARASFLSERLGNLSESISMPARVEVECYDTAPGREFDQKLAAEGLSREEIPEGLVDLAKVPRLFDLVIQLKDRLGGVEGVTIHRLLWEYGKSSFTTSAYGTLGWRQFILNLATEFSSGARKITSKEVEEMSSSAATTQDLVYLRVSQVIDGVFTTMSQFGELDFEPNFVRHALGLALVKRLEGKTAEGAIEGLEKFLQPINQYDEKAEIIRAAVSIALARGEEPRPKALLGALCCSWVQSQNLPEEHVAELDTLASEMIEPLLDAIERSEAASNGRRMAIDALRKVNKSDSAVARTVAARGAKWLGYISLERRGTPKDDEEKSAYARRQKRLKSRIGKTETGSLTVLGRHVEIVDQTDKELAVVAVQLLEGRPLIEAIDFLEAGAVHEAINGEVLSEPQWLNVLNTVDPEATAAELRLRSEAIASRAPEPGIHIDLNRTVAAILLRHTGYERDAAESLRLDPGLNRMYSYKDDYLADPGMSLLFALERRHAAETLSRKDIALRPRIDRVKEFLVDPSLEIPEEFVQELVAEAAATDFEKMARGRYRSHEDLNWRDYSLALARAAPDELARIERSRLRDFASRDGDPRLGAALAALDLILLAGGPETSALHTLRKRASSLPENVEVSTQCNLLIAEIQTEAPLTQVQRIVEADLDTFFTSLAEACTAPSSDDLDELAREYATVPHKLVRVAQVIGEKKVTLSEQAFDTFASLLRVGSNGLKLEAVWFLLGLNAPRRLGRLLDEEDWSWSAEKSPVENRMGSIAIAASIVGAAFSELAHRLAPTTLLKVMTERQCDQEEAAIGGDLLNRVVIQAAGSEPVVPLHISHDRTSAEASENYLLSYGDICEQENEQDRQLRFFRRMRDPDDYEDRRHEIADQYIRKVMEARRLGDHFLLEFVDPNLFDLVFQYFPDAIDLWLEGMVEMSTEFVQRVQSANGFFVSLCEALLVRLPKKGVALWQALRQCVKHVQFTVYGDMDRLLHALFTANPSAEVETALEEVYQIGESDSDQDLINLIVAARIFDRLEWLHGMVARDAASPCPLHQRRAAFLGPLLTVPDIAGDDGWPEGETGIDCRSFAWKLAQREAFALHWLRAFAKADTAEEAHAAWRLFVECADRRVFSWMDSVLEREMKGETAWQEAKQGFVKQQTRRLRRGISDNEKNWQERFAGYRFPKSLWPWINGW